MATQASPAMNMSQRIKINPKPAPSSHGTTGPKHPPRSLNKSNSTQLPNTQSRPSPSPTVVSAGGGKVADRRKPSSMNGAGPGRGKSRPGTVDTQKRTAGESHTPSRLYSADVGADVVLSQPPKKLTPQPYVRTTGYILQKFRGHSPSLILHLHPTNFRFEGQDGSFSYTSPMRSLLEYIRNETIPPEAVEEFRNNGIRYYEGCLIVQIFDHRTIVANSSKNTSKNGQAVPASIHNQNEYLTPSPFVLHPMKDSSTEAGKAKEEGSFSQNASELSSTEPQENKPRIFTTVLHPTPASLHAEIQMLASTPMPPMRLNSVSRINGETPATPTTLTANTPQAFRPVKRQKMWLDDTTVIPFEAKYLQITNASLILTPATCKEHAQKILSALRHPAHNAPPPKPKTRKRTTAELAADEAQAAEEERLLLIMDERHQPDPVAGGAPTSAVGGNDGTTGSAFEPSFKKWKMIEQIKAKKAEERRILDQQRAQEQKTTAGAAATQNAEMERRQREQKDKEITRIHQEAMAGGKGIPMNLRMMQGVQGMVKQHQLQQAEAAAAAATEAQLQHRQQHQQPPPQQQQQGQQGQQQPPLQPQQAPQAQTQQQQSVPQSQMPQSQMPQQQQPPQQQRLVPQSQPQPQPPQSQQQQPPQQQQIPGQLQFASNMQPQPPQQSPPPSSNIGMQPPPPQQQGSQPHQSPPQQPQLPQQQHSLSHQQPQHILTPQSQASMMRAPRMAVAGSPQLSAAHMNAMFQAQQHQAQAQVQQQAHTQQTQSQTPRLTAASPPLAQRNPNQNQLLRGGTPQPGSTPHSIAPHQSPAIAASQPISLQNSPHLAQAHQIARNNATNPTASKSHPNINIKPNPNTQQGQQGQRHPNQSPNIAMSSPSIIAGVRAMQAARGATPYIKGGMRAGPGIVGSAGVNGMHTQLTPQQMHQLQQQHAAAIGQAGQFTGAGGQGGQVMTGQFQDLGFSLGGKGRGSGGAGQGATGMNPQQMQQHSEQQARQQAAMQAAMQAQFQAQQMGMINMNGMVGVPQGMQGMQGMLNGGQGMQGQNFIMVNNGMGGVVNVPMNVNMMNMMNSGQGIGGRGRGG